MRQIQNVKLGASLDEAEGSFFGLDGIVIRLVRLRSEGGPDHRTDPQCHFHAAANTNTNINADGNGNANTLADGNANTLADGNGNTLAYRHSNPGSHLHTNTHPRPRAGPVAAEEQ